MFLLEIKNYLYNKIYEFNSMEEVNRDCGNCYEDCFVESQRFMLNDDLWLEVNNGKKEGKLCLDCVEDKLGRELTMYDLKDVQVNYKFAGILEEIPFSHDF
jgi:hypothetical protein